jgi:hypothetical protein
VQARGFINTSTRGEKENIRYVSEAEQERFTDKLEDIRVAEYNYKNDSEERHRLGLIAEEAPEEVLSKGGKGVDIYKLTSFTLASLKDQQKQIEQVRQKVDQLQVRVSGFASSSVATVADSGNVTRDVQAVFESFGHRIMDGAMYVKDLTVDTLEIGSSEEPRGVTMYDENTNEPYCLRIVNGEPVASAGKCSSNNSTVKAPQTSSMEQKQSKENTSPDTKASTSSTTTSTSTNQAASSTSTTDSESSTVSSTETTDQSGNETESDTSATSSTSQSSDTSAGSNSSSQGSASSTPSSESTDDSANTSGSESSNESSGEASNEKDSNTTSETSDSDKDSGDTSDTSGDSTDSETGTSTESSF